jgi:hypothetical protein
MIEYSLKTSCKVASRPENARSAVGQLVGDAMRAAKQFAWKTGDKNVERNDRAKRWEKKKSTYLKCRTTLSNEWAVLVEY